MVFADLIALILKKQGITAKQLGIEIGVTGATISNLATGRVLKPEGKTCQRLLGYCKAHNIDTSKLNWNKIVYNYFVNSRYKKEYEWYSDVDENGNFGLRHMKCGKTTTVPVMSLDGVSTPCIHCWTDAYMASDAYDIKLYPTSTEYPITHTWCGHKYVVSYEQIKQKKYLCPVCYRAHTIASEKPTYGKRQDYRFLSDPEKNIPLDSNARGSIDEIEETDMLDDDTPLDELSLDDFLLSFEKKGKKPISQTIKQTGAAFAKHEVEQLTLEHLQAEQKKCERLEAECRAQEQLEAERKERERLEAQRRVQEQLEAERKERERLEDQRRAQEQLEAERKERERLEAERRVQEQLEADAHAKQTAIKQLLFCLHSIYRLKASEAETRMRIQTQIVACLRAVLWQKEQEELAKQEQHENERKNAEKKRLERLEAERLQAELLRRKKEQELQELEAKELRDQRLKEILSSHNRSLSLIHQHFQDESKPLVEELGRISEELNYTLELLSRISILRFIERRKLNAKKEELVQKQAQLQSRLTAVEATYQNKLAQENSEYNILLSTL